ncbi:integrase core domain protein [Oesophagostomum dentatum]|uniref:Integrase core domain protein n=1 Tax=Oesophagostomum dentatum TaxID=61180 RepID=A0A0B1TGU5_OESDE|nr:integrase core domain protein [Oesophagostomum dentatum]
MLAAYVRKGTKLIAVSGPRGGMGWEVNRQKTIEVFQLIREIAVTLRMNVVTMIGAAPELGEPFACIATLTPASSQATYIDPERGYIRHPRLTLPHIPTSTPNISVSAKGLLTRGLNSLKDACKDYEDEQALSTDDPSRSESLLAMQRLVDKALETVKERWKHIKEEVLAEPDLKRHTSLMNEYKSHWNNQHGDEILSRAHAILKIPENIESKVQISTENDCEIAETFVIRHHYYEAQNALNRYVNDRNLKLILDEKGIYRENPILLLPNQAPTQMVIMKYHRKTFHAGTAHTVVAVREKYLVPNLRQLTKSILKQCVVCRRVQGQAYRYPFVPDLPSERATRNRPFQNIGLDYFGPLIIRSERNDKKKIWVCLFTCMVTRAVHLETVLDNSTIEFLSAFRRFIAKRGAPNLVISDNAPTFKLGSEVLQNELPKQERNPNLDSIRIRENIKWKFITPFSPWQGGFYERLVGSVKNALKKATGKAILTLRNFETVLAEVEAVLNTRPLTPHSSTFRNKGVHNTLVSFNQRESQRILEHMAQRLPPGFDRKVPEDAAIMSRFCRHSQNW